MVSFTFEGLFTTTNKGIPDTTNLPAYTTMSHSYYLYSVFIQVIFLLFFVLYFILSIYRVIKKIKNKNFREVPEQQRKEQNEGGKNENEMRYEQQVEDGNKQKDKEENLIYRFDQQEDEQHQKKGEEEGRQKQLDDLKKEDDVQKEHKEENPQQDFDDYHDAYQEPFINLDQKLLFLQPFLISFIIANNLFQADGLVLASLILMLACYFLINIKGYLGHLRLAPMIYMIFALLPYLSYFKGDHDLST